MCWYSYRKTWRGQTIPTLLQSSKVVNGFATRLAAMEWLLQEGGLHPWMLGHEWDEERQAWVDPTRELLQAELRKQTRNP